MDVFPEPEYAEALALRRAVSLAREEGYDRVTFASDCLSLIQRLNSLVLDRSSVGILVAEVKHMAKSFSSVSFCHVKRNLNKAAHILAKTSLFSSFFLILFRTVFRNILYYCVLINKATVISKKKLKRFFP
jgi:hypothetical protein